MEKLKIEESFELKTLPEEASYLAPDGSEIRLLHGLGGGGVCHCTLPEGRLSKAKAHYTVAEIWYFISGKGEVWRKFKADRKIYNQVIEVSPG